MLTTTIKLINKNNNSKYKAEVLTWLKTDYNTLKKPGRHFWHNKDTITKAFDKCDSIVALNNEKKVIGYMIWYMIGIRAEIDIIEVKKEYRRQGICRKLLLTFIEKFPNIHVLTGTPLEQAKKVFIKLGWKITKDCGFYKQRHKKYFKIVKPCLQPFNALPDGHVIAVCTEDDFYRVQDNPSKYKNSMKYFQINIDKHGKLSKPIITDFNYACYIGIYFNKKLIMEGKAKQVFSNLVCSGELNLLIIDKILPLKPKIFNKSGFFSKQTQKQRLQTNIRIFSTKKIKEKKKKQPVNNKKRKREITKENIEQKSKRQKIIKKQNSDNTSRNILGLNRKN